MDIGQKIRACRLQLGLTQEDLASRCDLTKGYISQLENDVSSPSISTLEDILNVLGVSLPQFFAEQKEEKIVFTSEDLVTSSHGDGAITWLVPNSQKNDMEPVLLTLPVNGSSDIRYPFEGQEFGYVLDGRIMIIVQDFAYKAKKGESFYLLGDKEHKIVNVGSKEAKILRVATPSNF